MARVLEEARLRYPLKAGREWPIPDESVPGHVGNTAHSLNNILATILAHAHFLEDQQEAADKQDHAAAIRLAVHDAAKSVRLIQVNVVEPRETPAQLVEVNSVIKGALETVDPQWRRGRIFLAGGGARFGDETAPGGTDRAGNQRTPGLDLAVTLRPAGYISGDPDELRGAVINIISSAMAAAPDCWGRIEITSGTDGVWAVIRVRDHGAGIPAPVMPGTVGPPFTTEGSRDSGLDLGISRSVVQRHGGDLEVGTEQCRGSMITISLPLVEP